MESLSHLDYIAFSWFIFIWMGYILFADKVFKNKAISSLNKQYRYQWMSVMLRRDNRIVDATIQSMLSRSASFFASTSMLIIGGCLASLGSVDQILLVTQDLPFFVDTMAVQVEIKIIFLVLIYIYAFFKFIWSFRLFNSCSILMGAVPLPNEIDDNQAETIVSTIAGIHTQAGKQFNNGIRSYMFSLPVLGWFISPYIFIIATTIVALIIQRREFYSTTHKLLSNSLETYNRFGEHTNHRL